MPHEISAVLASLTAARASTTTSCAVRVTANLSLDACTAAALARSACFCARRAWTTAACFSRIWMVRSDMRLCAAKCADVASSKAAADAAKCSSAASLCAWIASSSPDALIQRAGGGRRAVGSGALGRRSVSTQLKPNISASSAPITIGQSSPLKLQQVIRNHDETLISSQRETRAAYLHIACNHVPYLCYIRVTHMYKD